MESRADITAPKHVGLRKGTTVPTQAESKVNVSRSWHDELLASEDEPGANMPGKTAASPPGNADHWKDRAQLRKVS